MKIKEYEITPSEFINKALKSLTILDDYCSDQGYLGWDPFDGLNSKFFNKIGLKKFSKFRLYWIQIFKLSPINFRNLFRVSKGYNPKGLALFLNGYCSMYRFVNQKNSIYFRDSDEILEIIKKLSLELIDLQNPKYSGSCWGYNFDWQSRVFYQPHNTPTVVVTSFCVDALLDAYEITKNELLKNVAISSAKFVIHDLNHTKLSNNNIIFSYSPLDHSKVYNASLLGARLLARIYNYTNDENLKDLSINAAEAIALRQNDDGSWIYGEDKVQKWRDSFHTGFNLECLHEIQKYTNCKIFDKTIQRGVEFYINNFFLEDGTPKYYDDKTYPIDIHSPAQLIASLIRTNRSSEHKALIAKVLNWTIENMQSSKGYYFYRKEKFFINRIPYMRWSQSWMFYALCKFIEDNS